MFHAPSRLMTECCSSVAFGYSVGAVDKFQSPERRRRSCREGTKILIAADSSAKGGAILVALGWYFSRASAQRPDSRTGMNIAVTCCALLVSVLSIIIVQFVLADKELVQFAKLVSLPSLCSWASGCCRRHPSALSCRFTTSATVIRPQMRQSIKSGVLSTSPPPSPPLPDLSASSSPPALSHPPSLSPSPLRARRVRIINVGGRSSSGSSVGAEVGGASPPARPISSRSLPPPHDGAAPRGLSSTWSCVSLGNLNCPGLDELPRDGGCQVRCGEARSPDGKTCPRGRQACARLPSCKRMNTNVEGTWATLKGLVPNWRGGGGGMRIGRQLRQWRLRRGGGADGDVESLPWCAPTLRTPEELAQSGRPQCKAASPLCLVVAESVSAPDRYTSRPARSMPASAPLVSGTLVDYPRRRHGAIVHLTFLHDEYDSLPEAVAMIIDGGDRHLRSGSDVCAQAVHMRDVHAACTRGALRGVRALKSLAPNPQPLHRAVSSESSSRSRSGGINASYSWASLTKASAREFKCVRHVLRPDEVRAWQALLTDHLGPPPRAVFSYSGRGELLATRGAIRSLPRSAYGTLLATLLSRTSPHADALNALMPRIWSALLGGTFTHKGGFKCDHATGWVRMRADRTRTRSFAAAHLPSLRPPSLLPHAGLSALDAALSVAPRTPSARERATNCGNSSLICVVIAAHKESLEWVDALRKRGHPTLVYSRAKSRTGLYVVPNVFHEHAVYLRYICAFYHSLPKLSVFLHGHRTSWHNRGAAAVDQLLRMDLSATVRDGASVYRSFNDYSQCWRDGRGEWADEMLAQAQGWRREMEPIIGPPPILKESYCCTQFLVSADRIRSRPHAFWRRLLADLLDPATPQVCKVSGHVLELTWGYLLGEPANATCRKDGYGSGTGGAGSHQRGFQYADVRTVG